MINSSFLQENRLISRIRTQEAKRKAKKGAGILYSMHPISQESSINFNKEIPIWAHLEQLGIDMSGKIKKAMIEIRRPIGGITLIYFGFE